MNDQSPIYTILVEDGIRRFMMESDSFYPPNAVHLSIDEQRSLYNQMSLHFRKTRPSSVKVTDQLISSGAVDIPIRVYSPKNPANPPALLYLHGGGFILGDLESHDDICAEFCSSAAVVVIAVDYRLAPENPFPAAVEDCRTVLAHLMTLSQQHSFDFNRVIVGGDSAGANLAAGLCLYDRSQNNANIKGQVLIYPGLGGDIHQGSYISQSNAPGLSTKDVEFYRQIYTGSTKPPLNPYIDPLHADNFSGLPTAYLVAAHFDPLHDDCQAYAHKLQNAGVAAYVRDELLLVHAFLRARHISTAAKHSFSAIIKAIHSLAYTGCLP